MAQDLQLTNNSRGGTRIRHPQYKVLVRVVSGILLAAPVIGSAQDHVIVDDVQFDQAFVHYLFGMANLMYMAVGLLAIIAFCMVAAEVRRWLE